MHSSLNNLNVNIQGIFQLGVELRERIGNLKDTQFSSGWRESQSKAFPEETLTPEKPLILTEKP